MYDDILIPTDGSDGMRAVIEHVNSLAQQHDSTVHALYVANTASLSDLPMDSSWEGISTALHDQGAHAVEAVESGIENQPVKTTIVDGSPSKKIIEYAEDNDCDVIVMGTHGRSGVDRLLLGSVAERVVRSSPVPVLTIRVNQNAKK